MKSRIYELACQSFVPLATFFGISFMILLGQGVSWVLSPERVVFWIYLCAALFSCAVFCAQLMVLTSAEVALKNLFSTLIYAVQIMIICMATPLVLLFLINYSFITIEPVSVAEMIVSGLAVVLFTVVSVAASMFVKYVVIIRGL